MRLSFCLVVLSLSSLVKANVYKAGCESFLLSSDNYRSFVRCKGNFSEMESLKLNLKNITDLITVFELKDALLDVLPSDLFHDVPKLEVRKLIFNNVSLQLLEIPELGDPPLKSIKDTVESLEIYSTSTVFAWDFPSLSFRNLKNFIIEDSELISIKVPLFFWPELQFIQFQNSSLKWIHHKAFQGNRKLAICSLAHNQIHEVSRTMFPFPALKLYSLDLSFNKLIFLPNDMFSRMDMLQELKLDNNRLLFLSQDHFTLIWNNLTQLWLQDNDIPCDSVCWMNDYPEKPMFLESSQCKKFGKFMFIGMYLPRCS